MSYGRLIVSQKSFNEFTLAANDHPREPFEPAVVRNLRLRCKPFGKLSEILCGDMPAINAAAARIEGACIALGVNDPRFMDDEVAERLKRMESTIAHLEHLTERLNEVVTEQGRELGQLKKKYLAQAQSLETIELERIRSTNAKPPHYE